MEATEGIDTYYVDDNLNVKYYRLDTVSSTEKQALIDDIMLNIKKGKANDITRNTDPARLATHFERMFNHREGDIIAIRSYADAHLIGFLGVALSTPYFKNVLMLEETLTYLLDKRYKGFTRLCCKLLDMIALSVNADFIITGSWFLQKSKAVTNTYLKHGYKLAYVHIKELKNNE